MCNIDSLPPAVHDSVINAIAQSIDATFLVAVPIMALAFVLSLFLKEMPRFTRNYGDLGRPLLQALNVRWLVVSYPEVSTHGGRNLTHRYREFMSQLTDGLPWTTTEILFDGELVFCIEKSEDKP